MTTARLELDHGHDAAAEAHDAEMDCLWARDEAAEEELARLVRRTDSLGLAVAIKGHEDDLLNAVLESFDEIGDSIPYQGGSVGDQWIRILQTTVVECIAKRMDQEHEL